MLAGMLNVSLAGIDRPGVLLAILPAVGVVWLAARMRGGRWVLSAGSVALVIAALSGPGIPLEVDRPARWLIVQDVSRSVAGQQRPAESLPADAPVEVMDFASQMVPAGAPVDRGRTRLGPALRLAARRADELAGVVLVTDGRFHDDWQAAGQVLAQTRLPVRIRPMDSPAPDARIAALSADRGPDGRVQLAVSVASNARQQRRLIVRRQPDVQLIERSWNLLAGDVATVRLTDVPPADASAVYVAQLAEPDHYPRNDRRQAMALPAERRAALVQARPVLSAGSLAASAGLAVETVAPPAAPDTSAGWQGWSAVVVVDSEGSALSADQRRALAHAVRGGVGLVWLGAGPHQSPADRRDPIYKVLGLLANPYQRQALKVVVVLDASGSMAEGGGEDPTPRFQRARRAVLSLRRHLTDADRLEVITFSDQPRLRYSSGDAPADPARLADALAGVRPAGPTDVGPALHLAADRVLPGESALVLVVSDLRTRPIDIDALAPALGADETTLAVLPVGTGRSGPLARLADRLGATLTPAGDLKALGSLFEQSLAEARGSAVREGPFPVVAIGGGFDEGPASIPAVGAYVLSAARPPAEVMAQVGPDPILARAVRGLGRSVVVAVPLDRPRPALPPARAVELTARALRWVAAPADAPGWQVRSRTEGDDLIVTVELEGADAGSPVRAELHEMASATPGPPASAPFRKVHPSRWQARLPRPGGPCWAAVIDGGGRVAVRHPVPAAGDIETSAIGADRGALERLARHVGGQVIEADQPLLGTGRRGRRRVALWPALLAAGLAVMLVDWIRPPARR
jgi:hypothetical protein